MDKILLVDDEENILAGYQRNLRSKFIIDIATSGKEALKKIDNKNQYSLVISDYKMPEMNGVEFLAKVKEKSPDTVRFLLTGYADVNTAIEAVNQGNVFRILTKPYSSEQLTKSIYDGIEQYRLIIAEKELLDKTLKGSIKLLMDILSVVSPVAFNQATKYRSLSKKIAKRLNINKLWEIEIAALLSQIGCVAIPSDILNKKSAGKELNDAENSIYQNHPLTGQKFLENIPRLENIADAISYQFNRYDGSDNPENYKIGDSIPFIGRLLKVINDFDTFVKSGQTRPDALNLMKFDKGCYDMQILTALEAEISGLEDNLAIRYVNVAQLKPGMILAENLVDENNFLLITKDNEITEVMLERIKNYSLVRKISEPIKVLEEK